MATLRPFPNHPAVRWESVQPSPAGTMVEVTCPVCHEVRRVSARSVSYQIDRGRFTGRCLRDRLVNHARSDSPALPECDAVDWGDRVLVEEAGGRRRSMVRVRCPVCGEERLLHPSYLRVQVLGGTFRPMCPRHRKAASAVEMAGKASGLAADDAWSSASREAVLARIRREMGTQAGGIVPRTAVEEEQELRSAHR